MSGLRPFLNLNQVVYFCVLYLPNQTVAQRLMAQSVRPRSTQKAEGVIPRPFVKIETPDLQETREQDGSAGVSSEGANALRTRYSPPPSW